MTKTVNTRTESFTGISTLILKNELGDVTIRCTSTDGTSSVRLSAVGDVDFEPVTMRADGDHLVVDIPGLLDEDGGRGFSFQLGPLSLSHGATRVDVEVDVPADTEVRARTKSGDITLRGESGPVNAQTGSGDITLEHAREVDLRTGSGDVSVRTSRGGGRATTGSGDISIEEVSGHELHARAGAGDIALREIRLEKLTAATGSGDIFVHLGAGSLDCKSGTGDVDVTVPQGIPLWLDLSSGTGHVRKDVESVGAPQEGQPHLSIKAKSGVGSIRVHH